MNRTFDVNGTTYRYQDGSLYVQTETGDTLLKSAPGRWVGLEQVDEDDAEAAAAIWEQQR
jgi:hypothetical protein